MRARGCGFPKVERFIGAIWCSYQREASSSNSAMVWADDANTERGADKGICTITASFDEISADLTASFTLGGDGTMVWSVLRFVMMEVGGEWYLEWRSERYWGEND